MADAVVGELRYRARGEPPAPAVTRMVSTLLALEVERARAPEWASDEAASAFVRAVLARQVTDRGDIVARAAELGADVGSGAAVMVARATPHSAQPGDWRARVLTVALRALRSVGAGRRWARSARASRPRWRRSCPLATTRRSSGRRSGWSASWGRRFRASR